MYMMLIKTTESASGAHPPSGTLIKDAEMYTASIDPKKRRKHTARKMLRRQTITITSVIKKVVTSITVITARPVAQSLFEHYFIAKSTKDID